MKKLILILMVILLLAGSSQAAYADVAYEPENSFFDKYYTYMVPLDREFVVNGGRFYAGTKRAEYTKCHSYSSKRPYMLHHILLPVQR